MKNVDVDAHDHIALLRLNNGVTNAIGPAMVSDLSAAYERIRADFRGCVLVGGPKFFSIGLNLPELIELDRRQMSRFWDAFDQVVLDYYTLPLPMAAAICGHAVAGGTILSLCADYRLVAPGRHFMGLNEINIGLPVPYLADLMLRQVVADRAATDLIYSGKLIPPEEARTVGLVDGIGTVETIEKQALEWVAPLAEKSPPAFALIKRNRTDGVRREFERHRFRRKEEMLSCWFEPAVRKLLVKAAEKF